MSFFSDVFRVAAPIAAGYAAGGAGFTLAGSASAGSIAAGAVTGAGIAELSGDDVLAGGVGGGLGGLSGGSLQSAFAPSTLPGAPGATTATTNLQNLTSANLAQTGQSGGAMLPSSGNTLASTGATTGAATGGGYTFTPSEAASLPEGSTTLMGGIKNLGDGSTAMGIGKAGIMGAGVAGQLGAFDPEMPEYDDDPMNKYDPNRRLNLGMTTGIDNALKRDTGLRLLAEGGTINYQGGGDILNPTTYYQDSIGGRVYTGPRHHSTGAPLFADPQRQEKPVYGFVDVGGKFVEQGSEPGEGLMTQAEYNEKYSYDKSDTEDQGSGGDADAINKAAKSGITPGQGIAAIKSLSKMQESPVKEQTLGLTALENGGYLETGGEIGDGMSDEIPATINGTQEARLSDGEFVVPADVVSHLGNGSSDAGAKKLYAMMDKVRMARTGNKQQGEEIEAERFMPA